MSDGLLTENALVANGCAKKMSACVGATSAAGVKVEWCV